MQNKFEEDLENEKILGNYLDKIYSEIFDSTKFNVTRVRDYHKQNSGIDIVINHLKSSQKFYIDEKAQLDYINQDLPTFAFETSYLKHGELKQGWLFDEDKITDYYFLITSILCNGQGISSGIKSVKIHSIDRMKFIQLLKGKGLTRSVIKRYDNQIRKSEQNGSIAIKELNHLSEGKFYYSKAKKIESPINLVMKLSYLTKMGVAKIIYNP